MGSARLEAKLKLIQTAIEQLKSQGQGIQIVKTFALSNAQDIHPPEHKNWRVLSMEIAHTVGTLSSAFIYKYKGTAVHDLYNYRIAAASDPNREQCDLFSSELILDPETHITFAGGLNAYLFVTVMETDLSVILT